MTNSLMQVWILAYNTFLKAIKSKFSALFIIFAFILLYVSAMGSMLAVSHEERVLADISVLLIELLCLVYSVFQISAAFSGEIKNKNIYLLLSRPLPRALCLAGKELGIMITAAFISLMLGLLAALVIKIRGLAIPAFFAPAIAGSFLKIAIIIAFTFLISLIATSDTTTFILAGLFYILGHITSQLGILMDKAGGLSYALLKICSFLFPNLMLYSLRESGALFTMSSLFSALLWIAAAYAISVWLLAKKEF